MPSINAWFAARNLESSDSFLIVLTVAILVIIVALLIAEMRRKR